MRTRPWASTRRRRPSAASAASVFFGKSVRTSAPTCTQVASASRFERAFGRPWLAYRILAHDPSVALVAEGCRRPSSPTDTRSTGHRTARAAGRAAFGATSAHEAATCASAHDLARAPGRSRRPPRPDEADRPTTTSRVRLPIAAMELMRARRRSAARRVRIGDDDRANTKATRKLGTVAPMPQLGRIEIRHEDRSTSSGRSERATGRAPNPATQAAISPGRHAGASKMSALV